MQSDAPSNLRELRRFGFGAAVGLGLLALAAHGGRGPFGWLGGPQPSASVAFAALAVWTACAALLEPRLNRPLERTLHAVARAIAFLTLIVFFFGVLTPVGVVAGGGGGATRPNI
jgi:hypothetical protein